MRNAGVSVEFFEPPTGSGDPRGLLQGLGYYVTESAVADALAELLSRVLMDWVMAAVPELSYIIWFSRHQGPGRQTKFELRYSGGEGGQFGSAFAHGDLAARTITFRNGSRYDRGIFLGKIIPFLANFFRGMRWQVQIPTAVEEATAPTRT